MELYRRGKVLRARCGVREVETDFVLWLGACENHDNPWPAPRSRAEYVERYAERLTLAHALDVEGYRAYLGPLVELSDDEILEMLHGRRAESAAIPEAARDESRRRLAARDRRAT